MNNRKAYIAVTALFAVASVPGAIMNLVQPTVAVEMMAKLGLPLHLLTLVGLWKLAGIVAIARPQMKRLNEWAYAGFFFDLTGAAYLHLAVGDVAGAPAPLVLVALLIGSYVLRSSWREAAADESLQARASVARA